MFCPRDDVENLYCASVVLSLKTWPSEELSGWSKNSVESISSMRSVCYASWNFVSSKKKRAFVGRTPGLALDNSGDRTEYIQE